jgi:pyruvate-ferredoxin/flavodoxin oxidoreductase
MTTKKNFVTCDGNYAAAHVAYMFSEVAAIYPITPSSTMAEYVDEWAANGKKNIFGEEVRVLEMQSEAGAAGALHGVLQSGSLGSTFTCSQGLLLMIPNMYKMAGELLPAVFHVSARALAAQALSIFGDHSDVMSTRQTGFAMMATSSVQEVMDLAAVAHLAAIKSRVPFLHFFDGFRTSAEIQKIEVLAMEDLEKLLDRKALQEFRDRALNPDHPVTRGTAQNPDIYFQSREAANSFYDALPEIVEHYMKEMSKLTGRDYAPFKYYGAADADNIIIAMGSVTETTREVVDYLNAKGSKTGVVTVHLYRPFSARHMLSVIPSTVKRITVLDRTKEPGANGEPLYLDVKDIFYGRPNAPEILGGRFGLSSKDTTPVQIITVFENMAESKPKMHFTVGIDDDVTHLSLPIKPEMSISSKGTFEAKFYGLGSDGTVGANKNSIKIIGDSTDKYAQAYFAYDSKKSGGITVSHLRFGDKPIRSPYLVGTPDFVACHVPAYLEKYDMLKGIKNGGTFLLNSIWDVEETKDRLPNNIKKALAQNNINFYIINATKIAEEIGLGNRTNTIMQSAFFKIANVIPFEDAIGQMKKAVIKTFGRKGEEIVNMNIASIDRGSNVTKIDIPADWAKLEVKPKSDNRIGVPDFIRNVVEPINLLRGDDLKVSAFKGREDGTFPAGTTLYEKRGIAVNVPEWIPSLCIQCNQCSYVCPHASIRPFLIDEKEAAGMPAGTETLKVNGKGFEGLQFRIQVSPLDCTGCGVCVEVCPSKEKAIVMKPLGSQTAEIGRWEYMSEQVTYKDNLVEIEKSVKNSQFAQPLFQFSGACGGCGETPYVKLVTQLFGDRMIVANATGCSSIYGGSAPSTPYSVNKLGKGPAWANSLFEDNAEYGLGIALGAEKQMSKIANKMKGAVENNPGLSAPAIETFKLWLDSRNEARASKAASLQVIEVLKNEIHPLAKEILDLQQFLIKKSIWIFGGDGWAYDIGFGGLDHVLASGENVNVLVMDTEVYSNTGGQASKSTPIGAVAKFAAAGKRVRKKDLGAMAMTYGYVYVAQVAMGASQNQYLKALREAEAYPGPSLIIAYSPCINHGLRGGMDKSQEEQKLAVNAGYWHLWRYNPMLEKEGKNPFELDSKEPEWSKFQEFLNSEVRYTSLKKAFPKEADELFLAAEENAKWRFNSYKMRAALNYSTLNV